MMICLNGTCKANSFFKQFLRILARYDPGEASNLERGVACSKMKIQKDLYRVDFHQDQMAGNHLHLGDKWGKFVKPRRVIVNSSQPSGPSIYSPHRFFKDGLVIK